ncbi:MAG: GvpL/GvpF family gas vesicle protein [Patescibacteria group bacterium]
MVKGFYIYCIRNRHEEIKGVGLLSIPFRDIEATAMEVDLSEFNEKEIKDRLQNDAMWTEKSIRHHHELIDQLGKKDTVIPCKFGTVFRTKKRIEEMLEKYYKQFNYLLSWLSGKQEWGLKVYLDNQKFIESLKKEDQEVLALQKRKETAEEGMKWYLDQKMGALIDQKLGAKIEKSVKEILEELKQSVQELALNELVAPEESKKNQEMILNSACLLKIKWVERWQKDWEKFFKKFHKRGLSCEITGPWPPYNFVDFKNEKVKNANT